MIPVKITNADIIKSGERELIDTIIADLDWDMIEKIVRSRHRLKIQDDIDYRQGDLIVHNDQVAYKLDFDVKMTLSVIFDRDGNYLSINTSEGFEEDNNERSDAAGDLKEDEAPADTLEPGATDEKDPGDTFSSDDVPSADPNKAPTENFSKMASHIAEMISEINDD